MEDNDRRKCRSSKYQFAIVETNVPPDIIEIIGGSIDPVMEAETQASLAIQDQMLQRFRELLAPPNLTPRQFQVVNLIMEGHTQWEAATALGVNRSSIAKSLLGNTTYFEDGSGKHYGGVGKRIVQTLLHDPLIKQLCCSIYNFDNRGMVYHLCRTAFDSHDQFLLWLYPPPEPLPEVTPQERKKQARQKTLRKYNRSPKAKATKKRFKKKSNPQQLKEYQKAYQKIYLQTERGRANMRKGQKKYFLTEKGKAAHKRAQKKYNDKKKAKKSIKTVAS